MFYVSEYFLKEHPEYYIDEMLLDFANEKAREFITERVSSCIEKYGVEFVKFDFNITKPYSGRNDGFYAFYKGYEKFITALKKRFPCLYITVCGAGGYMTELYNAAYSDDFWISDDQSLFGGLEILKGYIKRMPPARITRFMVNGFMRLPSCGNEKGEVLPIYIGNATWSQVHSADTSFAYGFVTGGTLGISCDMTVFPKDYRSELKSVIADYKLRREFYRTAEAFVLCDSDNLTILQYSDKNFDKCVLQIFTKKVNSEKIVFYPKVDFEKIYSVNGKTLSGKDILEKGIIVSGLQPYSCKILEMY